ncbi:MAG TPA: carotenoid biosynthesis protein [Pyrinomonadaceae bacterium]|nr:carotenoid biosynthesis protein [Pyrinomonadaceae bacterium]
MNRTGHDEEPNSKRGWRVGVAVALALAYAVLWAGGVAHYLFVGAVAAAQNWLASAFLAVAGAIVLTTTAARADFLRLVAAAGFGLLVELCGVYYDWPFGRYAYTGVLRPTVAGVPVVMACAWLTLVAYVQQASLRFNLPPWRGALVGAAWMTAIDLVIDPLAANQLGYWRWVERGVYYGVPFSNFAGWFVVSFSIFALLRRPRRANAWHRFVGLSIILFFTLIALSFHLWTAALVGFGLCAVDVLPDARRRRSTRP